MNKHLTLSDWLSENLWRLADSGLLTGTNLRVLVALCGHADKRSHEAYPGQGRLADLTGLQRRQVRDALADMKAAGWIVEVGTAPRSAAGRPTVRWRITLPGMDPPVSSEGDIGSRIGRNIGRNIGSRIGSPVCHEPEPEPELESPFIFSRTYMPDADAGREITGADTQTDPTPGIGQVDSAPVDRQRVDEAVVLAVALEQQHTTAQIGPALAKSLQGEYRARVRDTLQQWRNAPAPLLAEWSYAVRQYERGRGPSPHSSPLRARMDATDLQPDTPAGPNPVALLLEHTTVRSA